MAEEVKSTEAQQTPQAQPAATQPAAPAVDMDKLADILDKKLSVTEKGVMKSYFEQQGLSSEEAAQAIEQFKTGRQQAQAQQGEELSKAQQALQAAQQELSRMKLENAARRQAAALNLDEKSADYALRLADLSGAVGQDGAISEESIKAALEQVLKDIPALVPKSDGSGFRDVGLPSAVQQPAAQAQMQNAKRWNRFNHNM